MIKAGRRRDSVFAKTVPYLLVLGLGGVSGAHAATASLTYSTIQYGRYQLDDAVSMSSSNSWWRDATLQQDINANGTWTDLQTRGAGLWGPGTFHVYFQIGNSTGSAQIIRCRNTGQTVVMYQGGQEWSLPVDSNEVTIPA